MRSANRSPCTAIGRKPPVQGQRLIGQKPIAAGAVDGAVEAFVGAIIDVRIALFCSLPAGIERQLQRGFILGRQAPRRQPAAHGSVLFDFQLSGRPQGGLISVVAIKAHALKRRRT